MVWIAEHSTGDESFKVRYDVVPYARGRGIDIGCGPWRIYDAVIGVDSQPIVGPRGPNVIADARKLDIFADGAFDYVYSSHALEDFEDTRALLTEWWRLVKPGGHLILYLPHKDFYPNIGQPGANPAHKHDFLPADIIAHMRAVAPDWDLLENQERDQLFEYSFLQVYRRTAPGSGQTEPWLAPKPAKTAAVVRYGALGDALFASSILPHLKAQGYHVTVYTQKNGELVLRHDPHIDRLIVHEQTTTRPEELIGFWAWHRLKYDVWINLVGTVETDLLPAPHDLRFYAEQETLHRICNRNYLEAVHGMAGVPFEWRQKFYPTAEEMQWARAERAKYPERMVLVHPAGSSAPKWWPYTAELAGMLHQDGIATVMVGDAKERTLADAPGLTKIGMDWPLRQVLAFALECPVVVGVESAVVNAVAFEAPLKIVILGHSSIENLTRDWPNTISIEAAGLECWPCHRLHADMSHCREDAQTKAAQCHAMARPERIADIVTTYFEAQELKAA